MSVTIKEVQDLTIDKAILANKNGLLIPVKATNKKNQWQDSYEKTIYTIKPKQKHRRIFHGENSVSDAIDWIEGRLK